MKEDMNEQVDGQMAEGERDKTHHSFRGERTSSGFYVTTEEIVHGRHRIVKSDEPFSKAEPSRNANRQPDPLKSAAVKPTQGIETNEWDEPTQPTRELIDLMQDAEGGAGPEVRCGEATTRPSSSSPDGRSSEGDDARGSEVRGSQLEEGIKRISLFGGFAEACKRVFEGR